MKCKNKNTNTRTGYIPLRHSIVEDTIPLKNKNTNTRTGDIPLRHSIVEDAIPLPLAPPQTAQYLTSIRVVVGVGVGSC